MRRTRRDLLKASALAAATATFAGCNTQSDGSAETEAETAGTGTDAETESAETETSVSVDAAVAVAAEWNAYRARLYDALALGVAGKTTAGAGVAQQTFKRFEGASGEWGAHEQLEATNESNYESFEEHLGGLRSALSEGSIDEARSMASQADQNLLAAQRGRVDGPVIDALSIALYGVRTRDVAMLAAADSTEAAATVGESVLEDFENASVHDAVEEASSELYEAFEGGLKSAVSAAEKDDAEAAKTQAEKAFGAALSAGYELAPEKVAGVAELAALQSVGFDAAAVANLSGPGTEYAHAASLTRYRARVYDVDWLAARGESDAAEKMAKDVFADFEGARAHEALEEADHDAYESFEGGLSDLRKAIKNGDAEARASAVESIDAALLAGIEALVGGEASAVLESAFFRARFADANERYQRGENDVAAEIAQHLFERFEVNEAGFHETVEETSEDIYHRFEEEHLSALITAYKNGDDEAVTKHHEGVLSTLVEFESMIGTAYSAPAESAFMAARAFDAAALATLGQSDRAASVIKSAFTAFEKDTGGFHESLEHADHDLYESFESELSAVRSAANDGGDVFAAATAYETKAVDAIYAVVASGSGELSGVAAGIVQAAFQYFEGATVHELLEEADKGAYETFEAKIRDLKNALESGSEVTVALNAYADATTTAQFAVAGAIENAPAGSSGSGEAETESGETEYTGGPNIVPADEADADHVVKAKAAAFKPSELTVSVGDTVAFEWAAGDAHNVVAREEKLPDGATYWASGGFDSEKATQEGWDNGKGALTEGTAYVHTFETAGEHPYYCIPHEAAGMEGTIVVEE
ncbi:plastocyanin [Halogeometricum borinquense DSM 11551]|uniref:Plastocyanin n=1 Tax=Halogeometricum borinquense (strain ATCC 700274 / DSM 11551 / JCM 10706 / KCTC 4070 / PR3) TaxID=469382 RepID=E4NP39_HALBP|nr:DUF5059 domain-containing protein [Halogeometricum borinquense]ADQ67580.1 plastocyanin [Halogeometricum borinquense DSM 11551]ELY23740.1 plastocyanin [Halogeometricum borinquense DSM 11551]